MKQYSIKHYSKLYKQLFMKLFLEKRLAINWTDDRWRMSLPG